MDLDLAQILESMLEQGPLVGYLFYQNWRADKKVEGKDTEIARLNSEMREVQDRSFERLATIKRDGDTVLMAIKDAIK